jgi:hypothetical protein
VNFELLECRGIFSSLGIGNVPGKLKMFTIKHRFLESGNAEATPNLFVRTSKLIALMCLHLSRTYPHEKESLTALFNSLFTVPNSTSIGALPTTIASCKFIKIQFPLILSVFSQQLCEERGSSDFKPCRQAIKGDANQTR